MDDPNRNSAYDYERCRAVWKRVSPELEPYPQVKNASEQTEQKEELTLPGAEKNPCCMGSEAMLSVEVLQGFLREELGDAQVYTYLARRFPRRGETAQTLRVMAEEEKRHARELAAAIYLVTGETYCPRVCAEQPDTRDACALLRRLYHAEACGGYNYARAAEETLDHCLAELFTVMSGDEYRHAALLLKLLGRRLEQG